MALLNEGLVLHGIKDLRLEKLPVPEPGPEEVLLQVECVGICGSDITHWRKFAEGSEKLTHPKVLGHEPAGKVVKLGKNAKYLQIGDRVAVEQVAPCCICEFYNCSDEVLDVHPKDGALQKYYTHNADFVHKLPESVSFEEGALLQPLLIAINAVKSGDVNANSKVLIVGAGTLGLLVLQSSKAFGATKVIISDLLESRLQKAKELGADYIYKVEPGESEATTLENMLNIFGEQPTVSFECVGEEICMRIALKATKKKGVVVIVGTGVPDYTLPTFAAQRREVDIKELFRLCTDYSTAVDLLDKKKIAISPLVTHRFKLEEYEKAFRIAEKREDNSIKVMFHLN